MASREKKWFTNRGQMMQVGLQLVLLAIAGKDAWSDLLASRFFSLGAILFYLLVVSVVVPVIWWVRGPQSDGPEVTAQLRAGALEQDGGLDLQFEHVDRRSTDPKITYHAKLRLIFANKGAAELELLAPSWTMEAEDVPAAFPFGYRYQLETTLGAWHLSKWRGVWDYSLWSKQELKSIRVGPGWSVTVYIALLEAVPHEELVERSKAKRLGTLTIPMKIGNQDSKWEGRV